MPAAENAAHAGSNPASRRPNFADFDEEWRSPDRSGFVVIPVPYEGTVSYLTGTGEGPAAILEASAYLEFWDEELRVETYRECGGVATLEPVEHEGPPETLEPRLHEIAAAAIVNDQVPVMLGGEHSLSLGPVRACRERWPELAVLHFDAHCDLRDSYEGTPYSHACIMRRVAGDGIPIVQVGIRSLSEEEAQWLATEEGRRLVRTFFDHETRPLAAHAREVVDALPGDEGGPVYVSIDMDAFDPAAVPGVGTPEPGGLSWADVTSVLRECCMRRRVVGFDVLEVRPVAGSVVSEFTAAKLTYRLMGYASQLGDRKKTDSGCASGSD